MISTALLVRFANGYREVVDAGAVAARGRREGFLSLGAVVTEAEVDAIAGGVLETLAAPRIVTTLGIEPTAGAEEPYAGWNVGDTIEAPDETGASVAMRVRSVAVSEDLEGNLTFAPEVRGRLLELEERLERWLRTMANGNPGGTVASASPVAAGPGASSIAAGTQATSPSGTAARLIVGNFPSTAVGDETPRLPVPAAFRVSRLDITAVGVGAGATTIALRVDGVDQATVSLAAGAALGYTSGIDVLVPSGAKVSFVPTANGGATKVLVAARVG